MKEKTYALFWCVCFVFLVSCFAVALGSLQTANSATAPPGIITYQGKLLSTGVSVTATTSMSFVIYDSLTGGSVLYTASGTIANPTTTQLSVVPTNGLFTVELGGTGTNSVTTSIFANDSSVFLEVWVGSTVLSPRKQLTATPYAINAEYLMGVTATNTIQSSAYIPIANSSGYFNMGRLGINSSTPQFQLAVSGTTYLSDTVTADGRVNIPGKSTSPTLLKTLNLADYTADARLDQRQVEKVLVRDNLLFSIASVCDAGGCGTAASGTVEIIDISNPVAATSIFVTSTQSQSQIAQSVKQPIDMVLHGNYLYIADAIQDAVLIYNVRDPANTVLAGIIDEDVHFTSNVLDGALTLLVHGSYLYVYSDGNDPGGDDLAIFDISVPSRPRLVGDIDSGATPVLGDVRGADMVDNLIYSVTDGGASGSTLTVIDVADPSAPTVKAEVNSSTIAGLVDPDDIAIRGKYAYIPSITRNELLIVDISDLSNISLAATTTTGLSLPWQVDVHGDYLYVGNFFPAQVRIYDIRRNPTAPVLIGTANGSSPGGNVLRDFEVGDGMLFLPGGVTGSVAPFVDIYDVTGVTTPNASIGNAQVGELFVGRNASFNRGVDVRGGLTVEGPGALVQGDLGIVGTSTFRGKSVFHSTTQIKGKAVAPTILGSVVNGGAVPLPSPQDVYIDGEYAYVVTDFAGGNMVIFNISAASTTPVFVSALADANLDGARAIEVHGQYAYVAASRNNSLTIVDVSNPKSPSVISSIATGGSVALDGADDVVVHGNYAYVTAKTSDALNIIDVSNPYAPVFKSKVVDAAGVPLNDPTSLFLSGHRAFITSEAADSLSIFNVEDPDGPVHLGNFASSTVMDSPQDVFVQEGLAYIVATNATVSGTLAILDIADPTSISVVGSVNGGLVGNDEAVNTRKRPFQAKLFNPVAIEVAGDFAYILAEDNTTPGNIIGAFEVMDVSNPAAPVHAGPDASISSDGAGSGVINGPKDLMIHGNYAYMVASTSEKFAVIDISGGEIANTEIGSARVSQLRVTGDSIFNNVSARGGVSIGGGGLQIQGNFGMSAPTTTTSTVNELTFSHSARFFSNATTSDNHMFIFDTKNTYTTANSSTFLLSVRNGGNPAFSVASNGDVAASGTLYAESATVGVGGPGDLAESVAVSASTTFGDVLVVDTESVDTYRPSTIACDAKVAGVVSTNPTLIIGGSTAERTALMAISGRVPLRVSDEGGSIQPGDVLVASSLEGHAMKYNPEGNCDQGITGIVGLALDSFVEAGTGKILALIQTGKMEKTIAELQQDIIVQQGGNGVNNLEAIRDENGELIILDRTLNLGGNTLKNVKEVLSDKWRIDEDGFFVSIVEINEKEKELYSAQSPEKKYLLSGSGRLENGSACIDFDSDTQALIQNENGYEVTLTLTENAKGLYAVKRHDGFCAYEINDGQAFASFDWVVVARRDVAEEDAREEDQMPEEQPPIEEEPAPEEEEPVEEQPEEELPEPAPEEEEEQEEVPPVEGEQEEEPPVEENSEPEEDIPPPPPENDPILIEEPPQEEEEAPPVEEDPVPEEELPPEEDIPPPPDFGDGPLLLEEPIGEPEEEPLPEEIIPDA